MPYIQTAPKATSNLNGAETDARPAKSVEVGFPPSLSPDFPPLLFSSLFTSPICLPQTQQFECIDSTDEDLDRPVGECRSDICLDYDFDCSVAADEPKVCMLYGYEVVTDNSDELTYECCRVNVVYPDTYGLPFLVILLVLLGACLLCACLACGGTAYCLKRLCGGGSTGRNVTPKGRTGGNSFANL